MVENLNDFDPTLVDRIKDDVLSMFMASPLSPGSPHLRLFRQAVEGFEKGIDINVRLPLSERQQRIFVDIGDLGLGGPGKTIAGRRP